VTCRKYKETLFKVPSDDDQDEEDCGGGGCREEDDDRTRKRRLLTHKTRTMITNRPSRKCRIEIFFVLRSSPPRLVVVAGK
jgi:hypothetical protein